MKVVERDISGFRSYSFEIGELIFGVPIDIGPRILHLASTDRPDFNLFGVLNESGTRTEEGLWRIYGGHRLWGSPEAKPRSYSLDDKPVKVEIHDGAAEIRGNPEHENSIQKSIIVESHPGGAASITHKIMNISRWPIRLGCWALSVMRLNGFALVPLKASNVDDEGLLPDRHITLWPYTDMSDRRLTISKDHLIMRQDPAVKSPLKIGTMANPDWVAYNMDGLTFVKRFRRWEGEYPDFGCSVEVYTNSEMLELETLGPLKTIAPHESIQHTEIWSISETGDVERGSQLVERIQSLHSR